MLSGPSLAAVESSSTTSSSYMYFASREKGRQHNWRHTPIPGNFGISPSTHPPNIDIPTFGQSRHYFRR